MDTVDKIRVVTNREALRLSEICRHKEPKYWIDGLYDLEHLGMLVVTIGNRSFSSSIKHYELGGMHLDLAGILHADLACHNIEMSLYWNGIKMREADVEDYDDIMRDYNTSVFMTEYKDGVYYISGMTCGENKSDIRIWIGDNEISLLEIWRKMCILCDGDIDRYEYCKGLMIEYGMYRKRAVVSFAVKCRDV